MVIRIPSGKVCEEFHLTYELKGYQKAINRLAEYCGIRRMKIVVDGRRVGNGDEACYDRKVAHFTRRGLDKFDILDLDGKSTCSGFEPCSAV